MLELGADNGARDKLGRTILHYVAQHDEENVMEQLLAKYQLDVDAATTLGK